jgi:predicted transcriptional regulator of viral defense system
MDKEQAKEIWGEICFLLSKNIKPEINEKDFEIQVMRAIEKLGWLEYKEEIGRQVSIQIGRRAMRPDIVIYDMNKKPLVPIEIKRPAENLSDHNITGQLKSYMRQIKAEFGLVIGDSIKLFYDGPEKEKIIDDPLLLEEIKFSASSKRGIDFVTNFNKQSISNQEYETYIEKLVSKIRAKQNINELKEVLLSSDTAKKIYNFLRKEYRQFGPDVVDHSLSLVKIKLEIDDQRKPTNLPVKTTTLPIEEVSFVDKVYNVISKNPRGIAKSDLTEITGLKTRQLSNVLYKLTRRGMVQSPERGVYTITKSEPTVSPKPTKLIKITKPKKVSLQGNLLAVYKAVRRKKRGNNFAEIVYRSGLEDRQVSNALYKLTKRGLIINLKKGHYIAAEYLQAPSQKSKPVAKAKSQSKLRSPGILEQIYNLINRYKNGLDVQSIREKTGLEARQVSNAIYKLVKRERIEAVERGKYIALQ